jgi:two-component system, OmpR family, response regulator RpaA
MYNKTRINIEMLPDLFREKITMDQKSILVIEDEDLVSQTIEHCLRRENFRVILARTGVEGLQLAKRHLPNLVVLDLIMPGMDGLTVCKEMRSDPLLSDIPILILTARTKDEDRVLGFLAGADDYLGKPFNVNEFILRIRAIMRRAEFPHTMGGHFTKHQTNGKGEVSPVITVKGYQLDTRTFELSIPGMGKIRLTPIQYDLLFHMMRNVGEVFSPARLLDEVWNYPLDSGSPDLVRVHIKNLRERIEIDPKIPAFIETVPGFGYTIRGEEN